MNQLVDSFGRVVGRMRISITDRCNLRCVYCMPENATCLAHDDIMRYEEISRIVRVAVGLGIEKVRITGGEPLARRGVPELVRQLYAIDGLKSVAITTNGTLLKELAVPLRDAGLRSLNISLDSLRRERYEQVCRRDELARTLEGIEAARAAGIPSIKVNCVVIRGLNDDEIADFAALALSTDLKVRFIEFMPLDGDRQWSRDRVVLQDEILDRIDRVHAIVREPTGDPRDPARLFRFRDAPGEIGIIASVSRPFCATCDRVRITADGRLRTCLFGDVEPDLKRMIRTGTTDQELSRVLVEAIARKERGRTDGSQPFADSDRAMHAIGG